MKVFIEVNTGSKKKGFYDEKSFELKEYREVLLPYPYPYGFIVDTEGEDGDAVDCYVITDKPLDPGTTVECEPQGILEFFEGPDTDYKVLATLPGENIEMNEKLRAELEAFISGIFKAYPEVHVKVGRILPKERAIGYIEDNKA